LKKVFFSSDLQFISFTQILILNYSYLILVSLFPVTNINICFLFENIAPLA